MNLPDHSRDELDVPTSPMPLPVIGGHLDGRTVTLKESNTVLCAPLLAWSKREPDGTLSCPVTRWRRTPSCWIWEGPGIDPDANPFPRISLFRSPRRSTTR